MADSIILLLSLNKFIIDMFIRYAISECTNTKNYSIFYSVINILTNY
jgi:uncharacterized protein YggT (Ycf19 family)